MKYQIVSVELLGRIGAGMINRETVNDYITHSSTTSAADRGVAIYLSKLKSVLEPEHNGEVVAIHIDSGDYVLDKSSGRAMRAMRNVHPDGQLLLHTIGVVNDVGDFGGTRMRIFPK